MSRTLRAAPYLLFAALTCAMALPVVRAPSSVLPNDAADPALNTWILWWGSQNVPLTPAWWDAPAFYPTRGVLAFSEHLLGLWPMAVALRSLGAGPQLTYNLLFLLSFPLAAAAMYVLVLELTRRPDAALVAGLVFGFAPYRMAHLAHLQVLASWWLPLALLGLHRFLADRRRRWLLLFAVAFIMQALTNGYLLLFSPLLFAAWALWFATGGESAGRRARPVAAIALAALGALLIVAPTLVRYRSLHDFYRLVRPPEEVQAFSADVGSLLDPGRALAFWRGGLVAHRPEGELFPGIAGPLLVLLAVASAARGRGPEGTGLKRARLVLAIAAVLFALAAVAISLHGRFDWNVLGLRMRSASWLWNARKAIALVAAAILLHPRARHAMRVRSGLAFYTAATVASWLLAFGPRIQGFGLTLFEQGPYALLLALPGFASLRVPARFGLLAALCLAVAAGLSFARLVPAGGRRRTWALGAVVAMALLDGWPRTVRAVPLPPPCDLLDAATAEGAVLEVPLGSYLADAAAMYRGMSHGRPVVNGYSGHSPPHYAMLGLGLDRGDHHLLDELEALGVRHVLVRERRRKGERLGGWMRFLGEHRGARRVGTCGRATLFRLEKRPAVETAVAWGGPLPIRQVTSSVATGDLPLLRDGDLETRWHTTLQTGMEELLIDLGEVRRVDGVVLSLGTARLEFPVALEVALSLDGELFTVQESGGGAAAAVRAAMADPQAIPAAHAAGGAAGRWVRLRQTGSDRRFGWSVAELTVRGR